MWSAGYQPSGVEPDRYDVTFTEDRAEFIRHDGSVITTLEIVVSPEDNAEVRRVSVANTGSRSRVIELTSYAELMLASSAADASHPAFSKLFVQTEYLPKSGAILATRRRRSPAEPEIWAAHLAVVEGEAVGEPEIETDRARFLGRVGGYELSYIGNEVLKGAFTTVAMALIATALAVIFAIPISFLAAHNLMSGNPVTYAIYILVRTLLNILRSIESLIIAIVFVVIVGLGPFAGALALAVHCIAALAKLYSEVIEGIDPGPIEAIRATGANWMQTVRYAVIPQIIPPFMAFTIYRWDINVRSATIIGFVGGGGIGFYLSEQINGSHYDRAGPARARAHHYKELRSGRQS